MAGVGTSRGVGENGVGRQRRVFRRTGKELHRMRGGVGGQHDADVGGRRRVDAEIVPDHAGHERRHEGAFPSELDDRADDDLRLVGRAKPMNQPWAGPWGFWAVPVLPAMAMSPPKRPAPRAVPRSTTLINAWRSPASWSAVKSRFSAEAVPGCTR